jgi:DNA-binding SARP family transcriptional activator/Tfp pilus assembly protein PilF
MPQPAGTFGELLLGYRLAAGISQRELARRAGLSVRALRDIEQGRVRSPRAGSIHRLAAALELSSTERTLLLAAVGGRTGAGGNERAWVGVLGPLLVLRGEHPIDIGATKVRCLLGLLAIQPGQPVTREQIVDVLWSDRPPKTCLSLVQGYLGRLRRLLETTRRSLILTRGGCLLRFDAEELDLLRFDDLVARAGAARSAGDGAAAMELLGRALDCWRGQLLADLDPRLRQHPAAVAIAGRRLAATLGYSELATGLGRHEYAVPRLRALVGDEPLHEGLRSRLMLALAGSGQQGAALDQFADVRARLADELGIEPGPEIAQAYVRVLRQDVPGLASREVAPIEPRVPAILAPAQLPPDAAAFTGRTAHLRQLDALVPTPVPAGTAVVITAITGTAGVGKTALAVHWAHRVRGRFPDGQLYVNLQGFATTAPLRPIEALSRFLQAMGLPAERIPVEVEEAAALYRSLVADRRMLVLLDDARSPEQLRPLLPGSPSCLVLVTSRDRLAGLVAHEGAHRLALDVLTPAEARALIGRVLGTQRVRAEPDGAVELANACARLPLALRVAMANLTNHRQLSISGYLARLRADNRLSALSADSDPQAAMRAALDLSYLAEPAEARRLFRRLSLVAGPDVTPEAAAALVHSGPSQAERVLDRLAAAHLIGERSPGRYAFHDLLRLYAAEHAQAEDGELELRAATRRLYDHYLTAVDAAARLLYPEKLRLPLPAVADGVPESVLDDHAAALAWLDAERPNLVAAVTHAAARGPRPAAWLLGDALRGYFQLRLYAVDWLAVAHAAHAAADAEGDLRACAAAEINLADANLLQSRYDEAIGYYRSALALNAESGWLHGQATALGNLGNAYLRSGRLEQALESHTRALALNRETGWLAGQAANLGNLGIEYAELGRLAVAADHYRRALRLYRRIGSRSGEAHTLANLGETYHWLGRLKDALTRLSDAQRIHGEIGDQGNEGDALRALADVHCDAGRPDQALAIARTALAAVSNTGYRRPEADALNTLGAILHRLDRLADAVEHYRQALRLANETGNRFPEARSLIGLADLHRRMGELEPALGFADKAVEITMRAGFQVLYGRALAGVAAIHLAGGRLEEGGRLARQALAIQRRTGDRLGLADTHAIAGEAVRSRFHRRQATALYAQLGVPGAERLRLLLP